MIYLAKKLLQSNNNNAVFKETAVSAIQLKKRIQSVNFILITQLKL